MKLLLRLALRDLRGNAGHLRLLVACLVLGVAAIAGVGSLSQAIVSGIQQQGQALLGGDIELRLTNRPMTVDERGAVDALGQVSQSTHLNAMVGPARNDDRLIASLKAVDGSFPLYGAFLLKPARPLQEALAGGGAVMDSDLADRLGLKPGDRLQIGEGQFTLKALIVFDPAKAGEGMNFGPSVYIASRDLDGTGLIQPGSLARYHYRLRSAPSLDVKAAAEKLRSQFPQAGWRVQTRLDGAPSTRRFIENLGQFLLLVGLTSLLVSGLGVANAVSAYLARKTESIATFKSLGATASQMFNLYLIQILLLALPSVLVGLAAGAVLPWLLKGALMEALPVPPVLALFPGALAQAAAFGLLVALVAAWWPLARARQIPAARLFRLHLNPGEGRPPLRFALIMSGLLLLIVALAVLPARDPLFALGVVGVSLASLLLLWGIGFGIRYGASRLPRPRRPLLRLALANLHRPGNVTAAVLGALGLGLTLLATLAVVQGNLGYQLRASLPDKAPTFFFLDIQHDEKARFTETVMAQSGTSGLRFVPSLRGPVTRINDTPVQDYKPANPEEAWMLRGDRGLTYDVELPKGNKLVAGRWWPAGYAGPPLVSVDAESARNVGLKLGDRITVSVLGVDLEARIASLRQVDWSGLNFNFALVYSPGTLDTAPHSLMATLSTDSDATTQALQKKLAKQFPTVSAVRVKDVLGTVTQTIEQVSTAIRATGLVTLVAGVLVLIGAIAASQSAKAYDSVILKVLGASRRQILTAFMLEYALLGLVASLMAVALGLAGGWFVTVQVLELEWHLDWLPLLATIAGGVLLTMIFGLAGTWQALGARPNQLLRAA
jgi:putative ABC transport system permease protein